MATTPTSLVNRLMGLEACLDGLQDCKYPLIAVPAATTTLTLTNATHGGCILLLSSTGGLAVTPPAATGTGTCFIFFAAATLSGGSFTFDAKAGNASDVMAGVAWHIQTGTTTQTAFPTASTTNLFTWNGGTTGGTLGSWVQFIDMKTNLWWVNVEAITTGVSATPFSNH